MGLLFLNIRDSNSAFDDEWDSLIILDACRYDSLKKLYETRYKEIVQKKISKGSCTTKFLLSNFGKGNYPDIVYISANPYVDKLLYDRFAEIVPVWDDGWDFEINTVPPLEVYLHALQARLKYPNKKLIVHFLQPHYPYLDGLGILDSQQLIKCIVDEEKHATVFDIGDDCLVTWDSYRWRVLPIDRIYQSYYRNLEFVLPYARRLADFLPGRSIITSDHGEAFGERISRIFPLRVYGHPAQIRIHATVDVPWVIIDPNDKEHSDINSEIAQVEKEAKSSKTKAEKEKVRNKIQELLNNNRL